ncbi:MAG: hypothetical protein ACPGJV_02905 [Bacteriovoracaceae bacterium]
MITSTQQLNATKKQISMLQESLLEKKESSNSILARSAMFQVEAQITELENEVEEYENLKRKGIEAIDVDSLEFEDLLLIPIKYRIATNQSCEEFGREVQVAGRAILKYELEEYANVNVATLKKIFSKIPLKLNIGLKEAERA